jgi:hypothetical protein
MFAAMENLLLYQDVKKLACIMLKLVHTVSISPTLPYSGVIEVGNTITERVDEHAMVQ